MAEYWDTRIVLEDGWELTRLLSYSYRSDFLIPSDTWTFTIPAADVWDSIRDVVAPDFRVEFYVKDRLQGTGFIDSVEVSAGSSGSTVTVSGRDVLKPLLKAHIHPDILVKGKTVEDLVLAVVEKYYLPGSVPTVFNDNRANKLLVGVEGAGQARATIKEQIEYCQAHPQEVAFNFVARNLRRFGLWMWAAADGSLVVSGPTYDQPASYEIIRSRSGVGTPHVIGSRYKIDRSSVPSSIRVRGKSTAKEFEKETVTDSVIDSEFRGRHFIEPMYIVHDQAESKKEAAAFARQEMSDAKRNSEVYECEVVGHTNPATGNVYAIDTIAVVQDQFCGIDQEMYLVAREFSQSPSRGTITNLRFVPKNTIQFSDVDAPAAGERGSRAKSGGGGSWPVIDINEVMIANLGGFGAAFR